MSVAAVVSLSPKGIFDGFYRSQCTRASIAPSQWRSLLDVGFLASTPIRVCAAAEPIFEALINQLCKKNIVLLIHSCGVPEATTCFAALAVLRDHHGQSMAIGPTLSNLAIRVLSDCGYGCPINIPGELHVGGAGLPRGYLNNQELTAHKFIPDPFSTDPQLVSAKPGISPPGIPMAPWRSMAVLISRSSCAVSASNPEHARQIGLPIQPAPRNWSCFGTTIPATPV